MKFTFYHTHVKHKFMPRKVKKPASRKKNRLPGYPHYPAHEDIFNRDKEESDLDPEDIRHKKVLNENIRRINEKNFTDDVSGGDLDIPGSELDDALEETGSEDEENNYYSLGGDNHHQLEEPASD